MQADVAKFVEVDRLLHVLDLDVAEQVDDEVEEKHQATRCNMRAITRSVYNVRDDVELEVINTDLKRR